MIGQEKDASWKQLNKHILPTVLLRFIQILHMWIYHNIAFTSKKRYNFRKSYKNI